MVPAGAAHSPLKLFSVTSRYTGRRSARQAARAPSICRGASAGLEIVCASTVTWR